VKATRFGATASRRPGERPARRLEGERIVGAQACHGVEK
jgi:hypothetical protein